MSEKPKSAMKAPASQLNSVKKQTKPPEKPTMLHEGQVIAAQSGNNYVVERLLGRGGFGEVHKVYTTSDPDKMFAMKVEGMKCKPGHETMLRLKIELHVFDTIAASTTVDKTHFVKMQDKGKTAEFKFYVMDIIWLSLKEVIEDVCKNVISPATMINIARQTLKGIDALHQLGFLHRDIKAANYAVGLPPRESIIYLLDFGIARPYKDEKTGLVKMPRARVPFMGTPRYASIRSMEHMEQCRKDDLEVWMYMMIELYDKNNILWLGEPDRKKIIQLKYDLQNRAKEYQKSGKLKFPEGYVLIINKIKDMSYNDKGDFAWLNSFLDDIVKKENINMKVPFEWVGKKKNSPVKPKSAIKKVEPKKETEKNEMPANDPLNTNWETKITFDPPKYVTFKAIAEKQVKNVTISNACDRAVTCKMKTIRHEVFKIKPVFFVIQPNTKQTIQLYYAGEGTKPPIKDRFSVDMMQVPNDNPDMATKVWKDKHMLKALAQFKKRKVLGVQFDGHPIPSDKPSDKIEEEAEKKTDEMKTGRRKKESRKKKKPSRKRDDESDPEEVVIMMEELKNELLRKKRRDRDRTREKTREKTRDVNDYLRDSGEDDDDSEDDYSEDEEEYRRRRKRGRKKRSREMTAQTAQSRDYSDRSDRDERDGKVDRRGSRRRRSPERRKRGGKKNYEEDEEKSGQQILDVSNSRKRPKDEKPAEVKEKRDEKKSDTTDTSKKTDDQKTPEKGSKEKAIPSPQLDDGAYMVLGDANEMEKAADSKEKMERDAKEQKSAAAKPEPEKKADDAAPAKK